MLFDFEARRLPFAAAIKFTIMFFLQERKCRSFIAFQRIVNEYQRYQLAVQLRVQLNKGWHQLHFSGDVTNKPECASSADSPSVFTHLRRKYNHRGQVAV